MELVYSDLNITAPSSSKKNYLTPKRKHMYSYISLDIDEDTMDFQYRDFENVFYQNEIWIDAILELGKKRTLRKLSRWTYLKLMWALIL